METRVQRYSNVAKKTSRRSLVAIASAAALFTVGGGVMAATGTLNPDTFKAEGLVSTIGEMKKDLTETVSKLDSTTQALKTERENHAADVKLALKYKQDAEKAATGFNDSDAKDKQNNADAEMKKTIDANGDIQTNNN